MDRRVRLERATPTADGFGEPIDSWATLADVWAAVTPVSDGERARQAEVAATVSHRFVIRWSATTGAVTPRDRLVYGGRVFDIRGVKEIGRREGVEISAEARAA